MTHPAWIGVVAVEVEMIALWLAAPAHATWSIVAVDPETEEVGVAGATCGQMVYMIGEVVPGHGAVAAQFATNLGAKHAAADALAAGDTPEEALAAILDPAFDEKTAIRQYGIASLDGPAVAFTGEDNDGPALAVGGETWTAQGNTLASAAVVEQASAAFADAAGEDLVERLLRALEAGAAEGGDARCDPDRAAKSAFLEVVDPDGAGISARTSSLWNGDPPVDRLRGEVTEKQTAGCDVAPGGNNCSTAAVALIGLVYLRKTLRPRRGA